MELGNNHGNRTRCLEGHTTDHLNIPPELQTMLPEEHFEEVQAFQTEIALQERIIKGQGQDKTLE